MIDNAIALEYVRSTLATMTGRPVYLAHVPERPVLPYVIMYPIPHASNSARPLSLDPGPWMLEIQATAVGATWMDASWMISKVDHEMRHMGPPPGASDISVRCTVTAMVGESVEVVTMIQRWAVAA